jgi:sRNA-binding protein
MPTKLSNEVILAAIEGFQSQKNQIDSQIAGLRQLLNGNRTGSVAETTPVHKRKKFSAAARRRMREAQQRRWAAVRGEETKPSAPATKSPKPKRRLSAAGRAAIIAATKKRWALKRAGA